MADGITMQQRVRSGMRPTTAKLIGIAKVSEEWDKNLWAKGTLIADPEVAFELSFRLLSDLRPIPDTYITYLALWRYSQTLFEYDVSRLCVKPDAHTYSTLVAPLIVRLSRYFPETIDRASIDALRRHQMAQIRRS
jgi:hypothetical protein